MTDTRTTSDRRRGDSAASNSGHGDETLVTDSRASLSPSQIIEQRLISMLKHSTFPVSHLQRRVKPGPR